MSVWSTTIPTGWISSSRLTGWPTRKLMQMRDIAIRETAVPVENISIVEINN